MDDTDGPNIARDVYEEIFRGDQENLEPDDIAYGLDTAVDRLRQRVDDPHRWATFIHLGM